MPQPLSIRSHTPADWLLRAAVILSLAAAAYVCFLHQRIIVKPGPMEYREGAIVATTHLLLQGKNPYALENLPVYTNVYGVFYNLVVLPFAMLFGNGFTVHRVASGVFLLASVAILFKTLRAIPLPRGLAVIAAVLFYADLAARISSSTESYSIPSNAISRPDSLGMLMFLGSVLLPWRCNFSHRAMLAACVLGVLTFFTKPYFVIGVPIVTAYLFFFRSKSLGLLYGVLFLALLGSAVAIVNWWGECFYLITVKVNQRSIQPNVGHLYKQIREYVTCVPGLTILLATAVVSGIRRVVRVFRIHGVDLRHLGTVRPFDAPLFKLPVDFVWFVLFCVTALFLWRLGQHVGNAMVYLYQIITPFVLLAVFRHLRIARRRTVLVAGLILLDCILLVTRGLPAPPARHDEVWQKWQDLIADKKDVYVAPPLTVFALQQGKEIYDSSMSEYFVYFAMLYPETEFDRRVIAHYDEFRERMKAKVRREEFDLIVLPLASDSPMFTTIRRPLVFEHYRPVGKMPFPIDWGPNYSGWIFEPVGKPEPQ